MKKIFVLILSLLALGVSAQFRDMSNLSLFYGQFASLQNGNNKGNWKGAYFEYMPIQTESGLRFGVCVVGARSAFNSNDTISVYQGKVSDIAVGLAGGKYFEYISLNHSAYIGANLMIKSSSDNGSGYTVGTGAGRFQNQQEDLLLASELNFNLLKNGFGWNEFFPRTQVRVAHQFSLKNQKESYWQGKQVASTLWNKSSFALELKQSLVALGQNILFEPKVNAFYHFYQGDKSNWLIFGPEIGFKRSGWDDFLTLSLMLKRQVGSFRDNLNKDQLVLMVNLNPVNLFNRSY